MAKIVVKLTQAERFLLSLWVYKPNKKKVYKPKKIKQVDMLEFKSYKVGKQVECKTIGCETTITKTTPNHKYCKSCSEERKRQDIGRWHEKQKGHR